MTKKGSIHSSNHLKQLPDVPVSETLGHAKSLLTACWDVIRLIWQWNSQQIYWQIFNVFGMMTESYLEFNNIYLLVDFKLN